MIYKKVKRVDICWWSPWQCIVWLACSVWFESVSMITTRARKRTPREYKMRSSWLIFQQLRRVRFVFICSLWVRKMSDSNEDDRPPRFERFAFENHKVDLVDRVEPQDLPVQPPPENQSVKSSSRFCFFCKEKHGEKRYRFSSSCDEYIAFLKEQGESKPKNNRTRRHQINIIQRRGQEINRKRRSQVTNIRLDFHWSLWVNYIFVFYSLCD